MRERSEGGALQVEVGEVVLGLVGAGRGHRDLDPAHAAPHLGADLQQLEPDGAAGRGGELGVAQADAPERLEQHISEGREPQPELVGAYGCGRGARSEEIELLLLDPVLHLTAGAVDVLVEGTGGDRAGWQRGHDEARVGALG